MLVIIFTILTNHIIIIAPFWILECEVSFVFQIYYQELPGFWLTHWLPFFLMRKSNQNLVALLRNISEGLFDTALELLKLSCAITVVHAWLFSLFTFIVNLNTVGLHWE